VDGEPNLENVVQQRWVTWNKRRRDWSFATGLAITIAVISSVLTGYGWWRKKALLKIRGPQVVGLAVVVGGTSYGVNQLWIRPKRMRLKKALEISKRTQTASWDSMCRAYVLIVEKKKDGYEELVATFPSVATACEDFQAGAVSDFAPNLEVMGEFEIWEPPLPE